MPMTLYGSLASPYVARVAMFADLKGIDLPMEAAPGGMGSDEYKQLNLTGKIPGLETGDGCITESDVICQYLEALHPEPTLIPSEPLARAQTLMVSRMTDLYIAPHNSPLRAHKDPTNRDQAVVDRQAELFAQGFAYVAHYMGPGPFAVADVPGLGDCALAPFIGMLKQTVFPFFAEIEDPTSGNGRLATWWQALEAHPVCGPSIEAYDAALEKFLAWLSEMLKKRGLPGG